MLRSSAVGNIGARQENEGGSYNFNYSMGPVSFGYGETLYAPAQRMNTASATAKTNYYDNQAFSIGFAVNDALSVSYSEETSEKKTKATSVANAVTRTAVEMEIETIDLAYTVGGMTLSVSNSETKNASYMKMTK